MTTETFADFGVNPLIVEALADHSITSPFPIQSMTLPVALSGHDIIGQAKTGTGKTLGFGIPLLHRAVSPGEAGFDELGEAAGKPQAPIRRDLHAPSNRKGITGRVLPTIRASIRAGSLRPSRGRYKGVCPPL